ncbi:MAG: ABC transporter permease subunit [Kiritimatiellia bacterium]|nr:ABC transporter permease subunit [Kiritimatiellia bacterium]
MRAYILRRLLISIPLVFLMTFVIFAVINTDPQSALDRYILNPNVSFQVVEQVKEQTGFYDAMPVRYMKWLGGVLFDIRIGRERRSLFSFADSRQFPEQFSADPSFVLASELGELSSENPAVSILSGPDRVDTASRLAPQTASYLIQLEVLEPGDPAQPARVTASFLVAGAEKPFEVTQPVNRAGPLEIRLTASALEEAGLQNAAPLALDVRLEGGGRIAVRRFSAGLDLYAIRQPEKRRPYLAIAFPVADAALALRNPGSPHLTHRLSRTDWNPLGKGVGFNDDGATLVSGESFRALSVEVGNPSDRDAEYALRIVSGPAGEPLQTDLPFSLRAGERTKREFSIAALTAANMKVDEVREIHWVARSPSRLTVYRTDLVVEGPVATIGWIPNFGRSHDNVPVLEKLGGRIRNTILLVIFAMIITWVVALPAGVIAAVRQYGFSDKLLSFLTFIGMAMPPFLLAVLVRYILQRAADPESVLAFLPDLPNSERTSIHFDSMSFWQQQVDLFRHAIAPTLVMAMGGMAGMQRVMRGTMLETQRQQYITTARAKGLSERVVIYKHALRNAITPFVAGFGSILPGLIGGSLFIEMVFNYPGVGQMMYPAVLNRDLNLVMANTLIAALLLVLGNLLADILLAIVDPRVSYA